MYKPRRFFTACAVISLILTTIGVCPMSVCAETVPMTWKKMDKAYISIIIDDNNDELQRMYDLITGEYGFPLCVAVPVKSYDKTLDFFARPDSLKLLHEIQDNGGEILSHNLTHKVFNRNVPWSTVDYELGESYRRLTAEGFRVNGVILAGGGGSEDRTPEYRTELEQYTSKYYKYSDNYGVSTQYYHPRKWLYSGYVLCKGYIDTAIENKSWDVLAGHGIDEEVFAQSETNVRQILDYLKQKQNEGVLEVVTYREVHKKFGNWATPVDLDTIPTKPTTASTTATITRTTATAITTTDAGDSTSKTRPVHTTTASFTTSATAGVTTKDTPEPQAPAISSPDVSTDARPTGEKDPSPWVPWVILGTAVAVCTAGALAAALIWRKKHRK